MVLQFTLTDGNSFAAQFSNEIYLVSGNRWRRHRVPVDLRDESRAFHKPVKPMKHLKIFLGKVMEKRSWLAFNL